MTVRKSLQELLAFANPIETFGEDVAFTGSDPVFPTPYLVGTAGAAVLGAVGLAASDLWFLRTKRTQGVQVDVRAAAAAMRSVRYLTIDGKPPKELWDPLSGYYPVKDGRWVSIHCNFPNHRDAAMGALARRATGGGRRAAEGGSWLVRVSLARTGKWIVDRGFIGDFSSVKNPEVKDLLIKTRSPIGEIEHLKPVLQLSETAPYWERPPVPLGTHKAEWPKRSFVGDVL